MLGGAGTFECALAVNPVRKTCALYTWLQGHKDLQSASDHGLVKHPEFARVQAWIRVPVSTSAVLLNALTPDVVIRKQFIQ